MSAILGFQQFGLPTVVFGLAWPIRVPLSTLGASSRTGAARACRLIAQTLHVKLTGAMVLVLILDGIGYLLAVDTRRRQVTTSWSRCWRTSSSSSRC